MADRHGTTESQLGYCVVLKCCPNSRVRATKVEAGTRQGQYFQERVSEIEWSKDSRVPPRALSGFSSGFSQRVGTWDRCVARENLGQMRTYAPSQVRHALFAMYLYGSIEEWGVLVCYRHINERHLFSFFIFLDMLIDAYVNVLYMWAVECYVQRLSMWASGKPWLYTLCVLFIRCSKATAKSRLQYACVEACARNV